ncbi:hydantoinase/oxoprolinase family protein [Roseomonas hellenica]|uniref:Hydantoinase/oxoprolinase family protein n=1 Tax=Plastoroseomonas hellenica TaxID=2687306 RepID=A0ABS5EUB1_9PROT|nr:hydantoinase/oxoprolinase family protein [Plastoroseomonas hellenica]MBR0663874.1 hydantoinase/oxoprolinase family protein [Plastoroseomonas hellenica]
MSTQKTKVRIGVDIGGTFTDISIMDARGGIITKKVASTVDNYARAIGEGLAAAFGENALGGADVAELLHGTTVASNAILELKGARTGLITTKGFRDVLELRLLRMPRLYDLLWEKPPALVERSLRLEVDERVDAKGKIVRPLDPAEVEAALDRLLAEKVEAISVCLLHAYVNDAHERMIRDIIRRRAPEMVLSISSEVLPEIKEYERTSTTVINSYVKPVVGRYLKSLTADLKGVGITAPLLLMQSNGGLTPAEVAAEMPVHIIESGPAAGVIGARALARRAGFDKVISFDMGGTTAKAALVENGEVTRAEEYSVGGGIMIGSRLMSGAGYVLKVPAIDLAEVGAGGGSIIAIDAGGAPQVGPLSAGAFPGPVCYDLGGTEPTVTDANVVLGYINPTELAGGAVKLHAEKSRAVLAEKIAAPLGLPVERAAHGAHLVAAANMIRAIKAVSSERGRDPREFALVAFGGNGPLFAAGMARALGIRRVIVPPSAGVFSAVGLLYSDVEYHLSRTYRQRTTALDLPGLVAAWQALEDQAREKLAADGFRPDQIHLRRFAKLHYKGQAYELSVPMPEGPVTEATSARLDQAFGDEHERTYGHRAGPGEPVELVSLNLAATGELDTLRDTGGGMAAATAAPGERQAYFGPEHGWLPTPILGRGHLVGRDRQGPVVIEEYDCTCVVPPGMTARLDPHGNITIDTGIAA